MPLEVQSHIERLMKLLCVELWPPTWIIFLSEFEYILADGLVLVSGDLIKDWAPERQVQDVLDLR